MSEFKALLVSDGRPGHYNLAEGVLAAVARRRPLSVSRLHVRRRRGLPGLAMAAMVRANLPPARILALGYGVQASDVPPANIVVSAGAETLAANIAVARMMDAANIFYGSLRAFRPADFALVLTSYAEQARVPHPVLTLKPSALDPDTLPLPVPIRPDTDASPNAPPSIGLLVGGDGGGVTFEERDWIALISFLSETHDGGAIRWIVSNSRRTPDTVSDRLRALCDAGKIDTLIDVRAQGHGTLTSLFAAADAVVCTADSSSMVSEAVWAGRPTLSVHPRDSHLNEREAGYRAWLAREGWCTSLAIADLDATTLMSALASTRPLRENPLARLSNVIAQAIPRLAD